MSLLLLLLTLMRLLVSSTSRFFSLPLMSAVKTTRFKGVVKRWNRDKAFGFIQRNTDGREIFVHMYELTCSGSPGLTEGEEVEFGVTGDGDRDRAMHVTAPGGGSLPGFDVPAALKSLPFDMSTMCSKCGSYWHLSRNCPGPNTREQWTRCARCSKFGHRPPDCPMNRNFGREERTERTDRTERTERPMSRPERPDRDDRDDRKDSRPDDRSARGSERPSGRHEVKRPARDDRRDAPRDDPRDDPRDSRREAPRSGRDEPRRDRDLDREPKRDTGDRDHRERERSPPRIKEAPRPEPAVDRGARDYSPLRPIRESRDNSPLKPILDHRRDTDDRVDRAERVDHGDRGRDRHRPY